MLKISTEPLSTGKRIRLPEDWRDKILLAANPSDYYPYDYVVDEIVKDKREFYYICKPEKKFKVASKVVLSGYALQYLLAEELEDSNVGLLFKEYLPVEDSKILITNVRNPSEVIPGIFEMQPNIITFNNEAYIFLDFIINFMNGVGFTRVKQYCSGNKKFSWKLLMHEDTSYMTEYELMFCDTLIHKEYVEKSCEKLASYLDRTGAVEHAKMLRERAKIHDNSKISFEDEMSALASLINDKSTLRDSTKQLSQIKQDAIKLHWKHNTHHPEHFKSPTDMSRLDVMEMCCDWHARSTQYQTNFLEFVKKRQEDRFHFPEWMFSEILHYCEILDSKF